MKLGKLIGAVLCLIGGILSYSFAIEYESPLFGIPAGVLFAMILILGYEAGAEK